MLGHSKLEFSIWKGVLGNLPKPKERYILQGQRMAWEKAHEIRIMMLLEATTISVGKNKVKIGNLSTCLFCYFFKSWAMFQLENHCYL